MAERGGDRVAVGEAPRLVGYAPGAFDMFHIGHLNLLQRARLNCDHLIAGVVSDDVAQEQKGQRPVVPQEERLAIVGSMRFVDEVYLECNIDKLVSWPCLRFDLIFKGDDWQGTEKGFRLERDFGQVGVRVVYLPYTVHTSSTRLRGLAAGRAASRAS